MQIVYNGDIRYSQELATSLKPGTVFCGKFDNGYYNCDSTYMIVNPTDGSNGCDIIVDLVTGVGTTAKGKMIKNLRILDACLTVK
jgi:hypothetical protein